MAVLRQVAEDRFLPALVQHIFQPEGQGALQQGGRLGLTGLGAGGGHRAHILGGIVPPEVDHRPVGQPHAGIEAQGGGQAVQKDAPPKAVTLGGEDGGGIVLVKHGPLTAGEDLLQEGLGLLLGLGPGHGGKAGAKAVFPLVGALPGVHGEDLSVVCGGDGDALVLTAPLQSPLRAQRGLGGLTVKFSVLIGNGQRGLYRLGHFGEPGVGGVGRQGGGAQGHSQGQRQGGSHDPAHFHSFLPPFWAFSAHLPI